MSNVVLLLRNAACTMYIHGFPPHEMGVQIRTYRCQHRTGRAAASLLRGSRPPSSARWYST